MIGSPEKFTLELNGVKMEVMEMDLPGNTAFQVVFSSKRKPIVVAMYKDDIGNKLWTSIPEGRKSEAAGVGKLIEEYFANKQIS